MDLIDKYFVTKHGKIWLDLIIKEFKFGNEITYTKFKQKIFIDFKKSVNYQLEGKEFNIQSSNYGKISNNTFDMDEFYSTDEITNMLHTRLHESIDYNSKSLAFYDIPQITKDYTQTKTDSQLLQSLINTNYTEKSNLTQNNKLGVVKQSNVVINTEDDYDNNESNNSEELSLDKKTIFFGISGSINGLNNFVMVSITDGV